VKHLVGVDSFVALWLTIIMLCHDIFMIPILNNNSCPCLLKTDDIESGHQAVSNPKPPDPHLLPTTKTENEMEGRLLLDVVVRKSATVFELLSSKDKTLLVRWDTLLVLDLCLYVIDGVRGLYLEGDGLAGESLDENLHTATETEDEMERGFLLDIVIREGSAVFELLSSKNETLLVGWNTLLVLDLGLDVVNSVRGLYLKGDGLSGESLDKDLHTTSEAEDKVKS